MQGSLNKRKIKKKNYSTLVTSLAYQVMLQCFSNSGAGHYCGAS